LLIGVVSSLLGIPVSLMLAKVGYDGLMRLVERLRRNDQIAPDDIEAQFIQLQQQYQQQQQQQQQEEIKEEPAVGVGMRRKKKKLIILED
jgi:hypothetical protein